MIKNDAVDVLSQASSVGVSTTSSHANILEPKVRKRTKCNRAFSVKNNIIALVCMCTCALLQNIIVGGANNAILTTIERAFFMTSIESALFLALYDVANIITSPIIGYAGDKMYKPTIIGLSMIGLSIGSIITSVPEFLSYTKSTVETNSYNSKPVTEQDFCNFTINISTIFTTIPIPSKSTNCGNTFLNNLKYFFYLANIINGVSSVALYTTAISYIENIFDEKKTAICQGIYYAVGAIGVGIGMLVTGNLLSVSASVGKSNTNKIDSNNVNWIGAWWIIYVFTSGLCFIMALIVMRFSPILILKKSNTSEINQKQQEQQNDPASSVSSTELSTPSSQEEINKDKKHSLKYHLQQFKQNGLAIITNKVYVLIVICTTFETLLIKGFSSYLTKYLEYQYRLTASLSTIIAGGIGFVGLICGALLGAFLIKRYKWQAKQCMKFTTIILFVTSFIFLGLLIHCPQEEFIGNSPHSKYNHFTTEKSKCNCNDGLYNPVCYDNQYIFQTACYAGCSTQKDDKYYDCHIFNELLSNRSISSVNKTLTSCSRPTKECVPQLFIVSAVGLVVLFMSSMILMPILKALLGSVSVENQSFALGIRSLVTKSLGNIPGPLVFAAIVDRSCVLWIKRSCTGNKTCRLYNNKEFSIGLGILGCCIRFLSAIFALSVYLMMKVSGVYHVESGNKTANDENREKVDDDGDKSVSQVKVVENSL